MLPTPPPMQQAEAKGPQKYIVYVENPPAPGRGGKLHFIPLNNYATILYTTIVVEFFMVLIP